MVGFTELVPVSLALKTFLEAIPDPPTSTEEVATELALGRVTSEPVVAPEALPPFDRTTVDGFAVRAADTSAASTERPARLQMAGEVRMGREADLMIRAGQAGLVHTGGMIPEGADSVVMIEHTRPVDGSTIELVRPASPGQNIIRAGEDVSMGQTVIPAGVRLRPQEIGGLMALGIVQVAVRLRPRVGVISTGDEVVAPDRQPASGQVRDVNSYSLSALVEQAGGLSIRYGIVGDAEAELQRVAGLAHRECEAVLIAAGSSVSVRDLTARVVERLGAPGILVHGIGIKPGKPTILAVCDRVPVIGLPGNPVSAFVVAGLFLVPALRKLLGLRGPEWPATRSARLSADLSSAAGREDYVPVRLEVSPQGLLAAPVGGSSNFIFSLVRADGLIRVPPEVTRLESGSSVEVRLFRDP
jgi:molybdopterin molybdotransferase